MNYKKLFIYTLAIITVVTGTAFSSVVENNKKIDQKKVSNQVQFNKEKNEQNNTEKFDLSKIINIEYYNAIKETEKNINEGLYAIAEGLNDLDKITTFLNNLEGKKGELSKNYKKIAKTLENEKKKLEEAKKRIDLKQELDKNQDYLIKNINNLSF